MRPSRSRLVISVVAVIASGIAVFIPPTAGAAQCGSVQNAMGKWSAIDVAPTPSVPAEGSSAITATSLVGQDPNVLLSTDGVAVYRSTDGGCKWSTTYTLGPSDYWNGNGLVVGYSITNIANGHSSAPANRQVVYLALSPNPLNAFTMVTLFGAAPPELLMVSHDGGQTFAPVQPAPTSAHPVVPECLSTPFAFVVPPAQPQEIYLDCPAGLAQGVAERQLAGGEPAYHSLDGGQSWSLIAMPSVGQYGGQWFAAGPKAHELWFSGQWSDPTGNKAYLAVWHTLDDGAHWTISTPAGKPGVGIGNIGLAIDPAGAPGHERVIAYAPVGAYLTTDGGKTWGPLRGSDPATGVKVAQAFFVRHTPYVITILGQICKPGVALLRYDVPRGRPATTPFPKQWGTYADWGADGSFAAANGGTMAFGTARFCSAANGSTPPPKLLSFQPR